MAGDLAGHETTEEAVEALREVGEVEVPGRDLVVVRHQVGVGVIEPGREGGGRRAVEPPKAEGAQLGGHRVPPDGQGPAVGGRLERRVPEAFPGRRQQDDIAGRVGIVDRPRPPRPVRPVRPGPVPRSSSTGQAAPATSRSNSGPYPSSAGPSSQ